MPIRYGSVGVASTRTVPAAPAAGGGGTGPEPWTDLDLTVGAYHPMEQAAGILADFDFTNPNPGELRIEHLSNAARIVWGGSQNGPVLIWPIQMVPRTFANPPGVTGNEWRCEDAILSVDMRIKSVGGVGGANPVRLGAGPMIVAFQQDQGEGAVFIANNPSPPYAKGVPPGIDNCYVAIRQVCTTVGAGNTDWNVEQTANSWGRVYNNLPGPIAAAGVADSARLTTAQAYQEPAVGGQSGGVVMASVYDSRVTDGGVVWDANVNWPLWSNQIRIEDRYLYVGINVSTWGNVAGCQGSYIVIDRLRYQVQPMLNRSL